MPVKMQTRALAHCCGVIELGRFRLKDHDEEHETIDKILRENTNNIRNSAYIIATFIDNPACKAAYDALKRNLTLVQQTEPRINNRHYSQFKNKLFTCIYKVKG
jgi:hypothetical protein